MKYRIVFDGPPGPEAGRFVEVENEHGESIRLGKWREDPEGNGFWWLEIELANAILRGKPIHDRLQVNHPLGCICGAPYFFKHGDYSKCNNCGHRYFKGPDGWEQAGFNG
jgi:hypothetical protein